MMLPTFFSRLDPFQAFRRVNFFVSDIPSASAIGVFCFELLPGALLSLIRQLGCLIPIFFALSKIGLSYTWIAFPASEIITGAIGISLYLRQVRQWAGGVD